MNPALLSLRSGQRPNGTGHGEAASDESGSPPVLSPSSVETDRAPRRTRNLADSPIRPNLADLRAPADRMGGTEGSRKSDHEYWPLLWGSWKVKTSAPVTTLAESIVQNVRGPLVVLDADLGVRLTNRAFCETFNVAPDEIEGRWFPELGVADRNVPRLRAFLDQILTRDGQVEDIDVEYDVPTTGPRTMMIRGQRLAGSGAGDILILLEIEDVTEREATEQHRRELIVTAVHELRNPLTAIKGYAQMMQQRKATSETALATILEQAQQLSRLVDDLL